MILSHHTFSSKTTIQCSSLKFVVKKDFSKGSQRSEVYIRHIDKSDTEQTESEVNMSDNEKILELASFII